jgi:hypothetical protein
MVCLRMRVEGWQKDDLRGSAQLFRKTLSSRGLLYDINFIS